VTISFQLLPSAARPQPPQLKAEFEIWTVMATRVSTFAPATLSVSEVSAPSTGTGGSRLVPKAINVFTNDGSFLDRFYRTKREEEEKRKQEEILNTKRNFENRFKNRGKRPSPSQTASEGSYSRSPSASASVNTSSEREGEGAKSKRARLDQGATGNKGEGTPISKYQEEMLKVTPSNYKPRRDVGSRVSMNDSQSEIIPSNFVAGIPSSVHLPFDQVFQSRFCTFLSDFQSSLKHFFSLPSSPSAAW